MCRKISSDQSPARQIIDRVSLKNHLGQIARDYGEKYIKQYNPPLHHIKYIRSIRVCKTPTLGGKLLECKRCKKEYYLYYSCGHSRCSICQSIKREQWLDKMSIELLKVPYVHLVTTMPHDFNGLARRNKKQMYNLLFRVTSRTIRELSQDPAHLGAKTGMISVLHTFGSDMKYHVHVHSLLTFGGIDKKGDWQFPKHKKRICRNSKLRTTYKRIFLNELKKLFESEELTYHMSYEEVIKSCKDKQWTIFVTHPTMQTQTIEEYLTRYINRVAVTNSRLDYIKETRKVHVLHNDYKNQKAGEAAPKLILKMDPLVFLHQLIEHIPPPYFQRTRRYGIHASAKSKLVRQAIIEKLQRNGRTIRTVMEIISHLMQLNPFKCENCGSTEFKIEEILPNKEWIYKWITLPQIRSPNRKINISHAQKEPIF